MSAIHYINKLEKQNHTQTDGRYHGCKRATILENNNLQICDDKRIAINWKCPCKAVYKEDKGDQCGQSAVI